MTFAEKSAVRFSGGLDGLEDAGIASLRRLSASGQSWDAQSARASFRTRSAPVAGGRSTGGRNGNGAGKTCCTAAPRAGRARRAEAGTVQEFTNLFETECALSGLSAASAFTAMHRSRTRRGVGRCRRFSPKPCCDGSGYDALRRTPARLHRSRTGARAARQPEASGAAAERVSTAITGGCRRSWCRRRGPSRRPCPTPRAPGAWRRP